LFRENNKIGGVKRINRINRDKTFSDIVTGKYLKLCLYTLRPLLAGNYSFCYYDF